MLPGVATDSAAVAPVVACCCSVAVVPVAADDSSGCTGDRCCSDCSVAADDSSGVSMSRSIVAKSARQCRILQDLDLEPKWLRSFETVLSFDFGYSSILKL